MALESGRWQCIPRLALQSGFYFRPQIGRHKSLGEFYRQPMLHANRLTPHYVSRTLDLRYLVPHLTWWFSFSREHQEPDLRIHS